MLKIHQPYKYKSKYIFALSSAGVFLLGSLWFGCRLWQLSSGAKQLLAANYASAAGDWRTIHDIENMQEMSQQICSNTNEGDTATLKDSRDPNSYVIYKASDSNCWMGENLRLVNTAINSIDSDMESGSFTIPASSISGFDGSDRNEPKAYYRNNIVYGVYYNWYTATAGSGNADVNDTSGKDIAESSICPKGWKLSAYEGAGSFNDIIDGYKSEWTSLNGESGYKLGYASNEAFWPVTGYIINSWIENRNMGYYWSRKVRDSDTAYNLHFSSSSASTIYSNRSDGHPVRCVAPGGLDKVEKPVWQDTADAGINVTVPKVITLDVSDGVNATADAYNVVTGEIVATVTSNNIDYEVLLSSEQPSLIGQKDSTNSIPVVSSTNPVEKSNNAWGILNASNLYDPITKTPQQFYNTTTTNGKSTSYTYGVGISISPTLPADTYSTTVTVTASSK